MKADFSKIRTIPLKKRKNKTKISDFSDIKKRFPDTIPDILAGKDFKEVVDAIKKAKKDKKKIIVMAGAHVIKCGLAPIIINLMKRGFIDHLAMNGAGSIHDFEIAYIGETSEDVAANIEDGTFGMADETGKYIHEALKRYGEKGYGFAVGKQIIEMDLPNKEHSMLAVAFGLNIPVTIHSAIGTEIIHQHPDCDGAMLGRATYHDFKIFTESICELEDGVLLNIGSAVVLPEVFLKAITVARNLGYKVRRFTTANFDMIKHYRPTENVVNRPTSMGGKGYTIIGMHEIMIPLLHHCLIDRIN